MTLTAKIITGIVIALGIYDLWAVIFGGMDSTISHYLQVVGFRAPVIVFAFGYIAGHIWGFFPPTCPTCGSKYGQQPDEKDDDERTNTELSGA